jgi:hypothetical protein
VADVPSLSLAAAKRLGIPAVALCSLNWLDLYRTYCGWRATLPQLSAQSQRPIVQPIYSFNRAHICRCRIFRTRSIGPIARIGRADKNQVKIILEQIPVEFTHSLRA